MSSKTKPTATKEEAKPALVPKLRFPEFREAKPWEEKSLGNEGELYSSLTGKAGADFDAGEARFVTYMNVFSNTFVDLKALRFVDVKEGENQNAVASGDVFFTISSETPDEVGMSSVLLEDLENCYLNSFCALFRFSESKRPNPVFTGYLLRQPLVRAYFTKKAQGSTRFNLSKDAFRSLPLCLPSSAEQQKIAECLSSVDELMAAQARKVDALKTHKKGLMQQLFPREGETQPRLRFPEFQNAGEWEESTVEEIIVTVTPPKKLQTSDYQAEGEFPIVDQSQDYICGWTDDADAVIDKGLPVIVFGDHTCALKFIDRPFVQGADGIKILRPKRGIDIKFLFCALEANPVVQETYKRHFSILKEKKLSFPDPKSGEQQRIATCLSSLDALITAETQKHEALKTHKKGLMQQLFPSPEEVEA